MKMVRPTTGKPFLFSLIFAKSLAKIYWVFRMIPKVAHDWGRRSSVGQSRGIIILES